MPAVAAAAAAASLASADFAAASDANIDWACTVAGTAANKSVHMARMATTPQLPEFLNIMLVITLDHRPANITCQLDVAADALSLLHQIQKTVLFR